MALAREHQFERIFRAHVHDVWRSLRYLGVAPEDLADVSQEVFVVVHRKLGAFDPSRGTLGAWIRGIAVRTAANYRRGRRRRKEDPPFDSLPERAEPAPQPERLRRTRLREALARSLEQLDDDKREVFVLFEIEEIPMKEVAELMGCPLQTAYARLYAARRFLAEQLRAGEEGMDHDG